LKKNQFELVQENLTQIHKKINV